MNKTEIVLSLISHTNIGKTTLTRTMLKRDVGEVRDEAHVTLESEAFTLLETESDALILWDTPGFGYVGKILKRLDQEGGATGWIMHEVVDRVFNRPLYSSLEAARNVRSQADLVLYMVNVRERPRDAGYVDLELQLLQKLGKPVLMILNQLRQNQLKNGQSLADLKQAWQDVYGHYSCLKKVLLLDAFTRTWFQELELIDTVSRYLDPGKRDALGRLRTTFLQNQKALFSECTRHAGETFWFALHQGVEPRENQDPKDLFQTMVVELQTRLDRYLDLLVAKHGIEAEGRAQLKADIEQVTGLVGKPLSEKKTGLFAGAVTSAGTGLMADILSGGLTFGGGALLGFLGGFLGGLSYAKVLNLKNKRGRVAWKKDALVTLFKLLLSYYLLAALHGRGKGKLILEEPAPFLSKTIEDAWPAFFDDIQSLIVVTAEYESTRADEAYHHRFAALFDQCAQHILRRLYGDATVLPKET